MNDQKMNQLISETSGAHLQRELTLLEERILKLKALADTLDPYQGKISPSELKALKEFELDQIKDPFALTNQLLKTMEDALERRQALRLGLGKTDDEAHFLRQKLTH